jgi:uncharacterized protein
MFNKAIGTSREIPVDINSITLDDLDVKDLKSLVRLSRTHEGLLLQVDAEGDLLTTCVRCLETFYLPVNITFEELYQFPSRQREETDLLLPSDGYIDLSSLYREYFILDIPIKHLCRPDCKGLCVICGANLNKESCEHFQALEEPSDQVKEGGRSG